MSADSTSRSSVSVLIPTLNAEAFLEQLLTALEGQQPRPPDEIILVDSMSSDRTAEIAHAHPRTRLIPIVDFSHGRARNLGAREAKGELLVLMTQDALPANEQWLARLLAPFDDPGVAGVYSRQIPRPGAFPMEQFFLADRFPEQPARRERKGDEPLTLENVFFSNVSAAVRRAVLLEYPFDESLIMSEDQQFARDVLMAGYVLVYQPDSMVIHSHNYSLSYCFRRYFDSVYSLRGIFHAHDMGTTTSMGLRYIRKELWFITSRHPWWLPYYACYNLAKIGGALAAHLAERLPKSWAARMSLIPHYWTGS